MRVLKILLVSVFFISSTPPQELKDVLKAVQKERGGAIEKLDPQEARLKETPRVSRNLWP